MKYLSILLPLTLVFACSPSVEEEPFDHLAHCRSFGGANSYNYLIHIFGEPQQIYSSGNRIPSGVHPGEDCHRFHANIAKLQE